MNQDREEFLKTHGEQWASILQNPSFMAGLSLLNLERLNAIRSLSVTEIKEDGPSILAGLQAYLQHEEDLFRLPVVQAKIEESITDGKPEYVDSIKENAQEHQRRNNQ